MRKIARVDIAAVLILVCLAAFFRFHRLQEVPIGLWRDEAANGLEALRVLDGLHGVFFGTREPMFIYLVAVSVALLGKNPVAIRIVAAIVGGLPDQPLAGNVVLAPQFQPAGFSRYPLAALGHLVLLLLVARVE